MLLTISNSFCCCRIITSCLLYFIHRIIHDCGNKTISHKQHKTNAHSHRTNLIIPHNQSIAIFIYYYFVDSLFIYWIWFAYFKTGKKCVLSNFSFALTQFASRFSFLSYFCNAKFLLLVSSSLMWFWFWFDCFIMHTHAHLNWFCFICLRLCCLLVLKKEK